MIPIPRKIYRESVITPAVTALTYKPGDQKQILRGRSQVGLRRSHNDDGHTSTAPKTKQIKKQKKIEYGEKRVSIRRVEFLHPAMWHDHDIDFARSLHPAMWHVAVES